MKRRSLFHNIQSVPLKLRIYRILRVLLVWFLFASFVNLLLSYMLYTPKSYLINQENKALVKKIEKLHLNINDVELSLDDLEFRDKNVYRALFGLSEFMDLDNQATYTDQKYAYLLNDRYHELLSSTWKDIDMLSQRVVTRSQLLDTVASLSLNKDMMSRALPSIMPIEKKHLNYVSDRFGYRVHPILRRKIFHEGIDLSCPRNTPVYSTADGVIVAVRSDALSGKYIKIDHGFGYMTSYAHLNAFKVEVGSMVKRGEMIALSGNTGRSTGAHLHYEVLYNRKNVNPENYFSGTQSSPVNIASDPENLELNKYSKLFMNGNFNAGGYGNQKK